MTSFWGFLGENVYFFVIMFFVSIFWAIGISFYQFRKWARDKRLSKQRRREELAIRMVGSLAIALLLYAVFAILFYSAYYGMEKTQENWRQYDIKRGIIAPYTPSH